MKADWEPIVGGWIRKDKEFFVEWVDTGGDLKVAKARRRIKGNTPMASLDVEGRPGVRRRWMTHHNAMKAIDKEFPMGQEDHWKEDDFLKLTWIRSDDRFIIQRCGGAKVKKFYAKENVGGKKDNWTSLRTKTRKNVRAWPTLDGAKRSIDKEFPMAKKDDKDDTPKDSHEETMVDMSFVFNGRPAEATRVISMFLSGKEISNLELKIEGHDPRPPLRPRRGL